MCEKVVEDSPWHLTVVPEHLKTQEMCKKAVEKYQLLLMNVLDHLEKPNKCVTR